MLKSFKGRTKLCNVLCALLTLCLVVLQFMPFWHFGDEKMSINGYVWLDPGNTAITGYFNSQLGSVPTINSFVTTAVLVLLLGVAGIILCITKKENGFMALLPAASSISALYAFAFKPAFRLGSTWIAQLILCIAILVFAVMAVVFGLKDNERKSIRENVLSQSDIGARVAAIRALGTTEIKKGKNITDSDADFNKLLTFLSDEVPECRIAAAEELGKTSREVAFTHISYFLGKEEDGMVIKAMRAALVSIRENMRIEHSQKA